MAGAAHSPRAHIREKVWLVRFTLSTRVTSALSPREFVELAVDAGYSALLPDAALLPWDSPTGAAEELGACAAGSGIEICAYDPGVGRLAESGPSPDAIDRARSAAGLAGAMGCRRLILPASARPTQPRELPACLAEEARSIRELIDSLSGPALDICIPFEINTLAHDHFGAVGLLQCIDRYNVQIVFDVAELFAARVDSPDKALRGVEDRLGLFVLRDFRSEEGTPVPERLTKGTVDWQPLTQRLTQVTFDGPVVIGTCPADGPGDDVGEFVRDELATARLLFGVTTKS